MRLVCSILLSVLAALPQWATAAVGKCDYLVATGAQDNPPFLWRDPQDGKRLIGSNADLLKRIGNSLGLTIDVLRSGDAQAAWREVESGRMDILADALVPASVPTMDFIEPAIAVLDTSAWVRRDQPMVYAEPGHLLGHRGLLPRGGDGVIDGHLQLENAASFAQGLQQLLGGKVDYLLYERYGAVARLGALGELDSLQRLEPAVAQRGMHLAIGHDSSCNDAALRVQLERKMRELQASGVTRKLLLDNLKRWQEQQTSQR
ncbi:substrate-binding periplasmic protein [Stutzerimonas kirkiae]|uniref:Amino acid ABC transporter substrate-binding protein n=1 Tax=Stutzerimonas kirkiae TaxID=2211392 RepID=A0A4Q9R9L3_9GAMM|nr:ABC transporter substrate-binding protein [Stutzerimonas kirkiae]TBU97386.1 amino acid ABC transporter substrate-binding protein [Stutzerimonas kirkiae]TBV00361.1 amino acid ABC transporter substrate-binding protein [Stutzerimonas kirkiae]TBV05513.1 amino acid ABC transporter substrate-binding protein [Stutzerimonas kirkiae]